MAIKNPPRTGHSLPNKAVVMMFTELPEENGMLDAGIVLAYNSPTKEFIVWMYIAPPEHHHKPPYCIDGAYFHDVMDALHEYLRRIHANRAR